MADYWDGVAKFFGYSSWQWGTAADWVAAVGTAGAFLFGFLILRRDRRLLERSLADSFATWVEPRTISGSQERSEQLEVHAFNAGAMPVRASFLVVPTEKGLDRIRLGENTANGRAIGPDQSTSVVITMPRSADTTRLLVEFVDGRGRTWRRQVLNGNYVSRGSAARQR